MISHDLRNLIASMMVYNNDRGTSRAAISAFIEALRDCTERVEKLEGMPVPAAFKLTDKALDDKVVHIRFRIRARPKIVRSNNGGDAE